jgi:predicted component of type VI protein secretion system
MGRVSLFLVFCLTVMVSGCAKKQDSLLAKSDTNGTVELNKSVAASTTPKEVNKTIKRTNITINSYSDCPSFTNSDYKTIPSE